MSEDQRKLLPYEHQLIDALGISKEEYLDFVAQQHIYSDIKEGTTLDIRNWELALAIVSIIGTLAQLVVGLLTPKPEIPQARGGQAATRDEVFAPRFAFNNAQQLAAYGDPVHLIYTNTSTNASGGVRVATSLIWSAVQSYGNSQLVQLLMTVGAGGIGSVDLGKSAFGQLPLRDLVAQNYWTYFSVDYTGALRNSFVSSTSPADPTRTGSATDNPYRIRATAGGIKRDGFSHAYSPTSSNTFGGYGAVPINVDIIVRNSAGAAIGANNGISMSNWSTPLVSVSIGQTFTVTLNQYVNEEQATEAANEANESRRTLSSVFDNSGVFKFGSAKLKLIALNRGSVIDGPMIATLQCIDGGRASSVSYDANQISEADSLEALGLAAEYEWVRKSTDYLLAQDGRVESDVQASSGGFFSSSSAKITAQQLLQSGAIYTVSFVGGTVQAGPRFFATTKRQLNFLRNLTSQEKAEISRFLDLDAIRSNSAQSGNVFLLKAIMRVEEASYETVSPCNIVDFSIRAKAFRKISGRQSEYGSNRVAGFPVSDNGTKARSAMFLVKYKKTTDNNYTYCPGIFVISRAADIENYIFLRFYSGTTTAATASNWSIKFEPVIDPLAEFASRPELAPGGQKIFHYLENSGESVSQNTSQAVTFEYVGTKKISSTSLPPVNNSPQYTNEWDLFSNTSDTQVQFSFDSGPEMALAAVTEQIVDSAANYTGLYEDLALFGLNMYSGKTVQDLRSLTLFVNQGRRSRLLRTSGTINGVAWGAPGYQYLSDVVNGFANTAPDIFIDTVLDPNDGIGQYATIHSVDVEQLARSKKFCERNQFFMDGVIAEPSSWREFWTANAGFSLLELAKVGGQDTLVPGVPYNRDTGEITTSLPIVALFNQGNILEDSYKEEFIDYGSSTRDTIITAVYRTSEADSAFAKNTSVDVKLTDTLDANAMRETVDMSAFVSRRGQAIAVAKFLCQIKRHSQQAIEFRTFPTDSPVFPGAYIYVELSHNQWEGIYTGVIQTGGALNTPAATSIPNGSYSVLCYVPNNVGTQSLSNVTVANNTAPSLASRAGQLFVLGRVVSNKRVFRVTEVTMNEEGEVTVRGVSHATDANGASLISRGIGSRVAGLFTIDGRPE